MMGRTFRIKLHLRRFARRHPWISFIFRSLMVFSVVIRRRLWIHRRKPVGKIRL